MRWVLEVGFIALSTSWKWLLGIVVGVGALVGILVGVGVIGEGGTQEPTPLVVAPTPTLVPNPSPTTAPIPTATLAPTSVPEPTAAPTAAPTPVPSMPETVTIQVLAAEAANIGSLEFVLVYDTDVWELSDVQPGSLAANALVDTHFPSPGHLWTGIVDPNGINGNGPLTILTFNRLGDASDPVAITIQAVSAFNVDTLVDVLTEATPGLLTPVDPLPPMLTFR